MSEAAAPKSGNGLAKFLIGLLIVLVVLALAAALIAANVVVDGGRRTVNIETRAVNRAVRVRLDADGKAPLRPELTLSTERARLSTLPANALRLAAACAGAPARISRDAGTYLCNATLWDALGSGIPSIFVHAPALPKGRRDTRPSYPLIEEAAVRILRETAKRLR